MLLPVALQAATSGRIGCESIRRTEIKTLLY